MPLNTRQKIYAAVLSLGAVALVADRTIFADQGASLPDPAKLLVAPADGKPAAARPPAPADSAADLSAFAARLETTAAGIDPAQAKDAFRLPADWVRHDAADPLAQAAQAAQRFAQSHHLAAVVVGQDRGESAAIVDGRLVNLSQTLDGFRLVALDKQSATWEANGARVKLHLQDPNP